MKWLETSRIIRIAGVWTNYTKSSRILSVLGRYFEHSGVFRWFSVPKKVDTSGSSQSRLLNCSHQVEPKEVIVPTKTVSEFFAIGILKKSYFVNLLTTWMECDDNDLNT